MRFFSRDGHPDKDEPKNYSGFEDQFDWSKGNRPAAIPQPLNTIWVLQCGNSPSSWNEDKQILMDSVHEAFPEKRWAQINTLVWETTDKSWKITSINKRG